MHGADLFADAPERPAVRCPVERPVRPLLERLRERRMLASTAALPGYGRANAAPVWVTDEPDPECSDAASEIERLRDALAFAEAALADIGDADREPGDDLAWCEARAAQALPNVRAALKA